MLRNIRNFRFVQLALVALVLVGAFAIAIAVPQLASAAPVAPSHTALVASAQSAPIENSIVPAILQVASIILIAQGIKSLARAMGIVDLQGKEAAIAYVIIGVIVYALETFLVPALSASTVAQLADFLKLVGILLAGSGLFDMTSAFRVPTHAIEGETLKPFPHD